jgi:hypothetical protein
MEELRCKGRPAVIADAITAQRARLGFFVEPLTLGPELYVVQSYDNDLGPYLLHLRLPFALIGPAPDGQSLLTSRAEGKPKETQWWESLVSELDRLGWLATTSEPTQAERDEDAPKIGAPRPTGSARNTAPTHNLLNIRQRKLLQEFKKHFNEDELRSLCFDLGVDYEDLQAQGKAGKARELILYQEQRGDSDRLIDRCRELRPTISWEDTSGISPIVASE